MLQLYPSTTTKFDYNGEPIRHAYDAHVIRDDTFYLKFKLLLDDVKEYKKVKRGMIVMSHTPDGVNYFRVWDITKYHDHIEVEALHLIYDWSTKIVSSLNADNLSLPMVLEQFKSKFQSGFAPFTISTGITDRRTFNTDKDETKFNALEVFLEGQHSIVGTWECELLLNGFDVRLVPKLGSRTQALLYEKKNITEFEDEESDKALITRIHAISKFTPERDDDATETPEEVTIEVVVDSPLINTYSQVHERRYVNNDAKTEADLIAWCKRKFTYENVDKPKRTIKVKANVIDGTEINYGDTLVLKYLMHDVDEEIRCVGYDYDGINKEFYEITLGSNAKTIGEVVTSTATDVSHTQMKNIVQATIESQTMTIVSANGFNRTTYGDKPPLNPIEDDKWFYFLPDRPNEVTIREFRNGQWVDLIDMYTKNRIETQFEEIDQQVQDMNALIESNDKKATEALQQAGASANVARQANEIAEEVRAKSEALSTELTEVAKQAEESLLKSGTVEGDVLSLKSELTEHKQTISDTSAKVDGLYQEANNLLVGTREMNIKAGARWPEPYFTHYSSGGVKSVDVPDSPVDGITKGIEIFGDDLGAYQGGFQQKAGKYYMSFWAKGKAGQKVRYRPVYDGTIITTALTGGWQKIETSIEVTSPRINYIGMIRSLNATEEEPITIVAPFVSMVETYDWSIAPQELAPALRDIRSDLTEVKQTATTLTERLSSIDGDDGRLTLIEKRAGIIETTLSSKVDETVMTNQIKEAEDGLIRRISTVQQSIVGRNYLLDSKTGPRYKSYSLALFNNTVMEENGDSFVRVRREYLTPGDTEWYGYVEFGELSSALTYPATVTISFMARANVFASFGWESRALVNRGDTVEGELSGVMADVDTDWARYSTKITLPTKPLHITFSFKELYSFMSDLTDFYIDLKDWKIELGETSSSWTPAPEDEATEYDDSALQESIRTLTQSFQSVKETSTLYERYIGTTENDIATKIASIVMSDSAYQREISAISPNTFRNHNVQILTNGWIIKLPPHVNAFRYTPAESKTGAIRFGNVIRSNGWWAISFDARGIQNTPIRFKVDFNDRDASEIVVNEKSDNAWKRYHVHFYVTNYTAAIYNFIDFSDFSWANFEFRDIMVYKGKTVQNYKDSNETLSTRVAQTEASWGVSISNATQALTSINANASGIRLQGKLIDLDGNVTMNDAFVKKAVVDTLTATSLTALVGKIGSLTAINIDVNKLVGNKTQFLQSSWKGLNSGVNIGADGVRAYHTDGSYTVMDKNGLWHVEGGGWYKTHFLSNVYFITGLRHTQHPQSAQNITGLNNGHFWYQLPAIYKNKQFSVVASLSDVEHYDYGNWVLSRTVAFVDQARIDRANARVPIVAYAIYTNLTTKAHRAYPVSVSLVATA